METRYDDIGRWYLTPEGVWCPSITTVLSILSRDGIAAWREEIGEAEADRISGAACERGTAMHDMLEAFCRNEPSQMEGEAGWLAKQLRPYLERNVTNIECIESQLWSQKLGVAGRCDLIAEWQGRNSIIDFKTAKKPKKRDWILGYFLQGCFYSVAAWQCQRIKTDQIVILMANDRCVPQAFVVDARPYYDRLLDTIGRFYREIPAGHFSRQAVIATTNAA